MLLSDVDIVIIQDPFDSLWRDHDLEGMSDGFDVATAYGAIIGHDDPSAPCKLAAAASLQSQPHRHETRQEGYTHTACLQAWAGPDMRRWSPTCLVAWLRPG